MPLDDAGKSRELMPRATIEQVVAHRNKALELYETAFGRISEADAAMKAAHAEAAKAAGGGGATRYTYEKAAEIEAFHNAVAMPNREQFLRVARRLTDIGVWGWVVQYTDLRRLMDREAKEKLDEQLRYVPESTITRRVQWRNGESAEDYTARTQAECRELIDQDEMDRGMPPVTVENIYATLQHFAGDAENVWRRGIANAFSKLDRRFKSHDGFKVGSRLILTYFFDSSGSMSYQGQTDTLIDIERIFVVLDGRPTGAIGQSIDALRMSRQGGGYGPKQSEVDTEYYKIRGFKNGNAHLWFTRDDLVEKVNKILADWYGEVIGDAQQQAPDIFDNTAAAGRSLARRYGFFPTPDGAADKVIEDAALYRHKDEAPLTILEPSAGTGNLARRCALAGYERGRHASADDSYAYGHKVDCVEVQPKLAHDLEVEGIYRRVVCADFLRVQPNPAHLYDRIIMNPPFDLERDIDHVMHALKFLKPDGQLLAVMSAGTEFRETRKAKAFREVMHKKGATFTDLPAGSFSEVGTNVNTIVVSLWNNDAASHRWSRGQHRF